LARRRRVAAGADNSNNGDCVRASWHEGIIVNAPMKEANELIEGQKASLK
jgi:hypothetical protein